MKIQLLKWTLLGLFLAALIYPFYKGQHLPKPVQPELSETLYSVPLPELATWLSGYPEPVDFALIADVTQKKLTFFSYFYPLIKAHNQWIEQARKFSLECAEFIINGKKLTAESHSYFEQLLARYKIDSIKPDDAQRTKQVKLTQLLKRMDVIPPELILVQAANESGWGTSRFAREGKNYFGQWCYSQGCGLVPTDRIDGMNHEVEKFEHAYEALDSYFINMNTNSAYRILRDMRASYRKMGQLPSAEVLATGLMNYSERGADYVQDIISMMRSNADLLSQAEILSVDKQEIEKDNQDSEFNEKLEMDKLEQTAS